MLYSIFQKLFYKIRQEAVLSIAVLLALLSACFVLPDASYFGYIDFRTLTILFSLMTVMSGLQRQGVHGSHIPCCPAQTASPPWYSSWSVYAFLQYADHERRCAPDLRSVLLCCTGTAAGSIR